MPNTLVQWTGLCIETTRKLLSFSAGTVPSIPSGSLEDINSLYSLSVTENNIRYFMTKPQLVFLHCPDHTKPWPHKALTRERRSGPYFLPQCYWVKIFFFSVFPDLPPAVKTSLHYLIFEQNELSVISQQHLNGFSELETLNLNYNFLTEVLEPKNTHQINEEF